jgi:hypothetical protein
MRRAGLVAWFGLLACSLSCTDPRQPSGGKTATAEKLRGDALLQAKRENKRVFLLFGTPTDEWSLRFDRFHAQPDVRRILQRYFVLVRIDIIDTPGGENYYHECPSSGVPAFVILDGNGMMLADSGAGETNVGFPVKPDEVERYCTALVAACPTLTEAEEAALRDKLQAFAPGENPDRIPHRAGEDRGFYEPGH